MTGIVFLHALPLDHREVLAPNLYGLGRSRPEADPPERRPACEQWLQTTREEGAAPLSRTMRGSAYATLAPELVGPVEELALAQTPAGLEAAIEAIRDRPDGRDVVAELAVPLVLVLGDSDPLVPLDAAPEILAAARHGELVVAEPAGRLPSLERPDVFTRALSELLERV